MKSLASWLTTFFIAMFWAFRILVAISGQTGGDFGGFIVFNLTTEVIMLFVTLLCLILIVKRNILGPIIYLGGYIFYFGGYVWNSLLAPLFGGEQVEFAVVQNGVVCILGLVLGLVALMTIGAEKITKKHYSDKQTDWFFGNENFDRKVDERADKNQYRTL